MRYKNFPVDVHRYRVRSSSAATWTFTNFLVTEQQVHVRRHQRRAATTSSSRATFKQGGRKVEGQIKEGRSDYGRADGTCTSAKRNYDAKRGDKGPHPQPKAKIARAFRVAG